MIDDVKKGNVDVIEVLDSITNATSDPNKNGTLFIGDIDTTLNTLSTITDVITENTTLLENITNVSEVFHLRYSTPNDLPLHLKTI